MTPQQLDELATRHAVFVTTASHMQHPRNDLDRWQDDWAAVNQLVTEINRLLQLSR
jgi:hypothetical protein